MFFGKKRKILIKEAGEGRKEVKMKILVVNCGSSTLKFQLIDSETEEVSASGLCERPWGCDTESP